MTDVTIPTPTHRLRDYLSASCRFSPHTIHTGRTAQAVRPATCSAKKRSTRSQESAAAAS
jgi:hypothetical protein